MKLIEGGLMETNKARVEVRRERSKKHSLWVNGVKTSNASTNKMFKMCVALIWIISNFPRLGI